MLAVRPRRQTPCERSAPPGGAPSSPISSRRCSSASTSSIRSAGTSMGPARTARGRGLLQSVAHGGRAVGPGQLACGRQQVVAHHGTPLRGRGHPRRRHSMQRDGLGATVADVVDREPTSSHRKPSAMVTRASRKRCSTSRARAGVSPESSPFAGLLDPEVFAPPRLRLCSSELTVAPRPRGDRIEFRHEPRQRRIHVPSGPRQLSDAGGGESSRGIRERAVDVDPELPSRPRPPARDAAIVRPPRRGRRSTCGGGTTPLRSSSPAPSRRARHRGRRAAVPGSTSEASAASRRGRHRSHGDPARGLPRRRCRAAASRPQRRPNRFRRGRDAARPRRGVFAA